MTSCHDGEAHADGPLTANGGNSFAAGFRVNVDESYTFSDIWLANSSESDVTIESVTLPKSSGLALVGALVTFPRDPDRGGRGGRSGARGFPPDYLYPMRDAEGADIPPVTKVGRSGVQLALGLVTSTRGESVSPWIDVTYRTEAGDRYALRIPYEVTFCAPRIYYERHPMACG
jgi:hypothetical protein